MRRLAVVLAVLVACAGNLRAGAGDAIAPELGKHFAGYSGCFVMKDMRDGAMVRYEPKRCAERLPPFSTFKVFNAMAGLTAGVLLDETTHYKWDGVKRDIAAWNADQTLASAMRVSAVWYFQRVATEVGAARMKRYLDDVGYGNRDISGGLTHFWLGSSLAISADEQVAFLERLYRGTLPTFTPHAHAVTRKVLVLDDVPGGKVSGKTGSGRSQHGAPLGWFVGHVVGPTGAEKVFAVNIEGNGADGRRAKALALAILRERGLI